MRKDSAINTVFSTIIIAILTGCYLYSFSDKEGPSKAKVTHDFLKIESTINEFKSQVNRFPSQDESINILLNNHDETWSGPFLGEDLLSDPWGEKYQYVNNKQIVFVASSGPNKNLETKIEDVLREKFRSDDLIKIISSEKKLKKSAPRK